MTADFPRSSARELDLNTAKEEGMLIWETPGMPVNGDFSPELTLLLPRSAENGGCS